MPINGWERLAGRRRIPVSVSMDPELVQTLDRFWRIEGLPSRSALIESLIRDGLAREQKAQAGGE